MELAIHRAACSSAVAVPDLVNIHAALMASAPNQHVSGLVRTEQNWIGGNNYNPCGASFVGPPPQEVARLRALVEAEALALDHLEPAVARHVRALLEQLLAVGALCAEACVSLRARTQQERGRERKRTSRACV